MDRRQRLRRDVEALDWRDFQRLVHDLVKKAHPQARSLESPDGGADTLVPPNADSAALVFQAKHTPRPSEIKWQHWTNSLDAALANHRPSHVTFVVSPDFNANEEHAFRTKLVDPHPAVVVDVWTLTDVSKLLEEHADVKTRYFGREHEDQITAALRAVQLGGPLQSGANLVQHAETLGRFANEHDKNYTYATTSAAPELPEPRWDEMNRPFMGLSVKGEQVAVYVNAWLREGAEGQAYFTFTDDDAGAEARERTRIELASGRDAVLRAGVHVQVVNAPTVMSEAFADGMEGAEVTIRPGDPVPREIRIFGPDGACQTQTWDFRPIPSKAPRSRVFRLRSRCALRRDRTCTAGRA